MPSPFRSAATVPAIAPGPTGGAGAMGSSLVVEQALNASAVPPRSANNLIFIPSPLAPRGPRAGWSVFESRRTPACCTKTHRRKIRDGRTAPDFAAERSRGLTIHQPIRFHYRIEMTTSSAEPAPSRCGGGISQVLLRKQEPSAAGPDWAPAFAGALGGPILGRPSFPLGGCRCPYSGLPDLPLDPFRRSNPLRIEQYRQVAMHDLRRRSLTRLGLGMIGDAQPR